MLTRLLSKLVGLAGTEATEHALDAQGRESLSAEGQTLLKEVL